MNRHAGIVPAWAAACWGRERLDGANVDGNGSVRHLLQIVVDRACVGCETARALAAAVRSLGMPDLEVDLIDLSEPDAVRPAAVFAVPTYLLDGRVLSLGNPEPEWLLARLAAPAAAG